MACSACDSLIKEMVEDMGSGLTDFEGVLQDELSAISGN